MSAPGPRDARKRLPGPEEQATIRAMNARRLALVILAFGLAALNGCASSAPPKRSLELDRANVYGAFLAARYAGAVRDTDASAKYFQSAINQEPHNAYILERAFMSALASGNVAEAARLAERALKMDSSDRLARVLIAATALREGRYQDCLAAFQGQDLGPFNRVLGSMLAAWAHAGLKDTDAALAALAAPADAPIFSHLMDLHRALILEAGGRDPEPAYKHALATGVLERVAAEAYGRWLERQGRGSEAKAIYDRMLESHALDPVALTGLARIARGERPAPMAGSPAAGASLAVYGPAATLAGVAQSDLAAVYLELALYLDPGNGAARLQLGDIFSRMGRTEESLNTLIRATTDSPYYEAAKATAAWQLARLDRRDEAVVALEALAAETGSTLARGELGNLYRATERYESCAKVFDSLVAAIDGKPARDDWRLYYARGACRERVGRWPEAEADLKTALALFPDQPEVLNYLGYTWVDRGENLAEGMKLIARAVELQPEAGHIVDSLGWAHYQLGAYEEAVIHLERAVEIAPQDPTINDHLGDAYWRAGRRLEASFQWTRALSLEPAEAERPKIERKLVEGLPSTPNTVLAQP